jgi:hypothetical protein
MPLGNELIGLKACGDVGLRPRSSDEGDNVPEVLIWCCR